MIEIAVTEPEYRKAEEVFKTADGYVCLPAPPDEEELSALIESRGLRHAVVGVSKYTGRLYETLPAGAVLARFGVGHDGIDKGRATEAGILCTNTPGVLTESVAEHTMALILAASRRTVDLAQSTKGGHWASGPGAELHGKTLAIIGCGAIGRRVAQIASFGFQMKVVGCVTTTRDADELRAQHGFSAIMTDLGQAVADSDFVSLHIPGGPATAGFLDDRRLKLLPARVWLVNTARGGIVDESALFDLLVAGSLAGAALDVTQAEPYRPQNPEKDLRTLANVIMTPHVGSNTREANAKMARRAIRNIQCAEAGNFTQMDLLNPHVLEIGKRL